MAQECLFSSSDSQFRIELGHGHTTGNFVWRIWMVQYVQHGHFYQGIRILVVVAFRSPFSPLSTTQGRGKEGLGHCLFSNTSHFPDSSSGNKRYRNHLDGQLGCSGSKLCFCLCHG
eukprot:Lithocolla_globosa_v1_NODE_6792_length_1034_cov_5.512768.p2 type:complete len:116 gc:universal NODE_6792_length_1034_cov_5.512768:443-96(-)